MTKLIKWLTNLYTRLWLRWHWRKRRVGADEYVHTMETWVSKDDPNFHEYQKPEEANKDE